MTKEEYFDARYKKTVEAIISQQEILLKEKSKRKRNIIENYIGQLKSSLSDMDNGTFWNPLREYYFKVMYENKEYNFSAYCSISVI